MDSTTTVNLLLVLLALYLLYSGGVAVYNIYFHPLTAYPGPILRTAFHFPDAWSRLRGTSSHDTQSLHEQYGDVVRITPNDLSFRTAQAWKDIYNLKPDRTELEKHPVPYKVLPVVHILNANQEEHNRIRKQLAPGFSDKALLEQEPLLNTYLDLLISRLKRKIDGPAEGLVDMTAYYNFVTFDIIGDLVLGQPYGCLEDDQYHPWISNVFASIKTLGVLRFASIYPALWYLSKGLMLLPAFAAKRKAHVAFVNGKTEARLARETDRKDFMTYILKNNSKNDQKPLSHKEILVNARILLTAGSETTATHLSGATWLLLNHPKSLKRLQAEVRSVFAKAEDITMRSVSDEKTLPYLNAVVKETFRLYPSVPGALPRLIGRGGDIIDGHQVPANTGVGVHQWSAYRSESNFAVPEEFHPERWLPDEVPEIFEKDERATLQPFSVGPRACLGKSLSYFELRSILTRMAWHFDMTLEGECEDWLNQKEYGLWDKGPLPVKLQHRPH